MPSFENPNLFIDFSRMTPPKVIEEIDFEILLARYKADVLAKNPDLERALSLEQSPTNIVLQAEAYGEMVVRARVNAAARAVMLPFATGSDLDAIGARFGVQRLVVTAGPPQVMESDERFRRRIQLRMETFSSAGAPGAYIYHALTAEPTLKDASAIKAGPGKVRVSLMSEGANPVPTEAQIKTVREKLSEPHILPLTDVLSVAAGEQVPVAIVADIYLYPGLDQTLVMRDINAALDKLRSRIDLLGWDLTRSQIITALNQEGVHSVALHSPSADVVTDPTKFVTITSVDIAVSDQRKE